MSSLSHFQRDFLSASSGNRAMIVQKACSQNQTNTGIVNMLANVNLNYMKNKNAALEAQEQRKADNIYFICKMLQSFPDFKYV